MSLNAREVLYCCLLLASPHASVHCKELYSFLSLLDAFAGLLAALSSLLDALAGLLAASHGLASFRNSGPSERCGNFTR
jgi:hypothetical protein